MIYVFAASRSEARPALAFARPRSTRRTQTLAGTTVNDFTLEVIITGVGRRIAAARTNAILGSPSFFTSQAGNESSSAVLVIGVCGGLTQGVPVGRIVVYRECRSEEDQQPLLPCSPAMTNAILDTLHRRGVLCDCVAGVTCNRIVTEKNDRAELAKTGAAAVDMESYDILAAAGRAGIPAAILRVASDSVNTEMPNFGPAFDAEKGIDYLKAMPIALCSPLKTLRLMAANRRALRGLNTAVKLVVQSGCLREAAQHGGS